MANDADSPSRPGGIGPASRRSSELPAAERIAVVSPFMEEAQPIGPEKRKRQGNPPRNPTREDSTSMLSKLLQVWTAAANKVRLAQSEYSVLRQNCLVAALPPEQTTVSFAEPPVAGVNFTFSAIACPVKPKPVKTMLVPKEPAALEILNGDGAPPCTVHVTGVF